MDTYYKIPKRLEEYRRKLSYTQEQMGELMDVGQDHYQRVEQGIVTISYHGLQQIEEHGGDIYYLITGKRQKSGYMKMFQCMPMDVVNLSKTVIECLGNCFQCIPMNVF